MIKCRKSSIVILIYAACLIVHLVTARVDDKLGLISHSDNNMSALNVSVILEFLLQEFMTL